MAATSLQAMPAKRTRTAAEEEALKIDCSSHFSGSQQRRRNELVS